MSFLCNFVRLLLFSARLCVLFVIAVISSVSYALPPHLQNFDNAKADLRAAFGQDPNGPLSVITVARSPIDPVGSTELISHDEFEQVLKLLYPLCSGQYAPFYVGSMGFKRIPFLSRIPGVDRLRKWWLMNVPRVPLNDSPGAQLPFGHRHIVDVDAMCNDFLYFHNAYLRNACNIVVFNEMFFSQTDPLTEMQKIFINDKLLELSQASAHTLLYPNFLYIRVVAKGCILVNIKLEGIMFLCESAGRNDQV
jgi:hypothetical protein